MSVEINIVKLRWVFLIQNYFETPRLDISAKGNFGEIFGRMDMEFVFIKLILCFCFFYNKDFGLWGMEFYLSETL